MSCILRSRGTSRPSDKERNRLHFFNILWYNTRMTKDELILENTELRARLLLAEKWMRREVANAIKHVQEEGYKKSGRKRLQNVLEEEHLDIITRRILDTFGSGLQNTPKYTLERLIDAEIYWSTLQQYPNMDALPVVLAYQKILDAWIEEKLIRPWRDNKKGARNTSVQRALDTGTERDLQNIILKDYSLSLGRFFQIIEISRQDTMKTWLLLDIIDFWQKNNTELFNILLSDTFFLPFQELMNREIFTKKRHEAKVTYSDAQILREILLDLGLLSTLFSSEDSQ